MTPNKKGIGGKPLFLKQAKKKKRWGQFKRLFAKRGGRGK